MEIDKLKLQKMKRLIYTAIVLLLVVTVGCENDDFLYTDAPRIYLSGDIEQGATEDSLVFSFRLTEGAATEQALNMYVNLQGMAAEQDLTFAFDVVDSLTNVPASAYEITNNVLPAGQYQTVVPVIVQRNVEGLDLENEVARVTFQVRQTDELGVGVEENRTFTFAWCDYLVRPASWDFIEYYLGPFSQARYSFIINYTGITEFDDFNRNYNLQMWLLGTLNEYLNEYNANPENAGNVEGWPYQNDNGEPLQFGRGLNS